MYEICSVNKLTTKKTREPRQQRRSGVFIINFKRVSHLIQVFLMLILNKQMLAG